MIVKDTTVQFTISQDNSDLEDFPNQHIQQTMAYSGPTWTQILEDVIKVMEVHFGYNIREHVYYAVPCPTFDHDYSPAPGREMHMESFLELLKANPKLNNGGKHEKNSWDKCESS